MDRPPLDLARVPRRAERAPFGGWVELALDRARRRARALDLSVHGIGLELVEPVPPARQPVVSEFALPGISLPLALEGTVVWTDPATARLGVAFLDVDPGLAELLASYVAGRL